MMKLKWSTLLCLLAPAMTTSPINKHEYAMSSGYWWCKKSFVRRDKRTAGVNLRVLYRSSKSLKATKQIEQVAGWETKKWLAMSMDFDVCIVSMRDADNLLWGILWADFSRSYMIQEWLEWRHQISVEYEGYLDIMTWVHYKRRVHSTDQQSLFIEG